MCVRSRGRIGLIAWGPRLASAVERQARPDHPASDGEAIREAPASIAAPLSDGVATLFMLFMPLMAWRSVWVTERRTAKDLAEVLRWLVEDVYEDAERVVLVCDNLNTHTPACLYEAFPPEQARRIAEKLEWHYTPKHGSWLNMAEIELSVLSRQCLGRRIESAEELEREVGTWQDDRNEREVGVQWRFTTAEARIKLRKLYPTI